MHTIAKLAVPGLLTISLLGCRTTGVDVAAAPAVAPGQGENVPTPEAYPVAAGAGIDDLVRLALEHHPEIDAAEAKVRRMMAMVPQAKALPDPKLRVSAGSMAETAAGRIDWMTGVEQALPFPGKLREMAQAAGKEAEAAAAKLEAVQLDVAAQVRRAYWNQYLAAQTTVITAESRDALKQIRDSVDARAAANQADQGDQLRLSTEIGKVDAALVRSRQGEGSARSRLNALLNRPPSAPLPAAKLDQRRFDRDLEALLAQAESQHPEVKAARAELEAFQHRLKRAELDRFPDFALGLQHASVAPDGLAPSANGRDQVFATLGITLPLWQAPRKARIGEATAGIEESTARIGVARASLRQRVEDAWLRAKSTEELITLFDKQIVPEAQQAFDGVLTGYSSGKQSFVDVLDVWRQLLAFRLQQATNQSLLGMAVADLRSAAGEQP